MAKRSASQPSASETPEPKGTAPTEGEGAAPAESTEGTPSDTPETTEASSPVAEDQKSDEGYGESETSNEGDGDSDEKDGDDLPDPSDENYNPYQDPSVRSSSLADVIVVELQSGESPTLDACREAYKDAQNQK